MVSEDVQAWLKRTRRKGPFYLYGTEIITYPGGWDHSTSLPVKLPDMVGTAYTVIWKDKKDGKVRIGSFKDGMYCRYGVSTWGVLSGTSMADFWQASSGTLDEDEMAMMLRVMKGEAHAMEPFDPGTIADLGW